MINKVDIPGFIDALAVFIKQEQAKAKRVGNVRNKQRKKANSS